MVFPLIVAGASAVGGMSILDKLGFGKKKEDPINSALTKLMTIGIIGGGIIGGVIIYKKFIK